MEEQAKHFCLTGYMAEWVGCSCSLLPTQVLKILLLTQVLVKMVLLRAL